MQYNIRKKPTGCSLTSINCYPSDELKHPTLYGFINTGTPQFVIYFIELEKIDFKAPSLKLYSSDLVYLRTDFPNIEEILEKLAPKSIKSNAKYRRTVEIDGVNYYCFRAKRFDYDFTHYCYWFFLDVTDEMLKEAYPYLKSLYKVETYVGVRPQSKLEVLEMLSEKGINIVPTAFKRTKDNFSDNDFYIDNIFDSKCYTTDNRLLRQSDMKSRLLRLIQSTDLERPIYPIESVLDRLFGINYEDSYSQTKRSFIWSIRMYRKRVNLLKTLELMTVATALKNPDIYFSVIKNIIENQHLDQYNPRAIEVIDYIYNIAIEDRLLTKDDVSNIANILRGEPIKDIEIEPEKVEEVKTEKTEEAKIEEPNKVEVEKIDLKPIERKVINLEELYKAKIASRQL